MNNIKDTMLLLMLFRKKTRRSMEKEKQRKFWVRSIFKEKKMKGKFHTLIQDMKIIGSEYLFKQNNSYLEVLS